MKSAVEECPKCGFKYNDPFEECPRCGIVVWRFLRGRDVSQVLSEPRAEEVETSKAGARTFRQRVSSLLGTQLLLTGPSGLIGRLVLWVLLLVWGAILMTSSIESNNVGSSFLHLVNLPFHEAGHIFFSPFGQFIGSLGGTLGQLLVPVVCFAVFLFKKRDTFSASVSFWWFGENFLDIAPYINDARAGILPLLGGNFGHSAPYGFHDWEYLLTELGWLAHDRALAKASALTGSLLMLLSITWGAVILIDAYRRYREPTT